MTAYGLFLAQTTLGTDHEARIRLLRQAIERDSSFASAWAALGAQYSLRVQDEGYPLAWTDSGRVAARRALDLDPELGDAYRALGHAHILGDGRLQAGIEAYSRALQVQPSSGGGANNLGVALTMAGRWPEAIEAFKLTNRLNSSEGNTNAAGVYSDLGLFNQAEAELAGVFARAPGSYFARAELSKHLARKGEYEEAMPPIEEAIRARPDHTLRRQWGARMALIAGDLVRAREHAEEAFRVGPDGLALVGDVHSVRTTLAYVRLMEGRQEEADALFVASLQQLESLLGRGADDPHLSAEVAAIKAAQGRVDEAASWLQRAYDGGFRFVRLLDLDPMFDSLRGHPEFERIMTEMRADVDRMREEVLAMEAELEAARVANIR
jgi:tetratricopeptide (TPR) repeat protein